MTDELKKIIFSQHISNVFHKHDWIINLDSQSEHHSYFIGEITEYYLNIYDDKDKINFEFTLDLEIPDNKLNELLMLINFANQHLKEGFFVFDFNVRKIKYNIIVLFSSTIEERILYKLN